MLRVLRCTALVLTATATAVLVSGCGSGSASSGAASSPATAASAAAGSGRGTVCPGRPRTTTYVTPVRVARIGGQDGVVVRAGHYVCGDPNPDAARFVAAGPERSLVFAPGARVVATAPVVDDSNGRQIPVRQLLSWLRDNERLHPVFTYTVDARGRISTFTEVYDQ